MSNFRPDEFTVEARVIGDATNVTESDLETLPLKTVKYWAGEILYKVCCSHIENAKSNAKSKNGRSGSREAWKCDSGKCWIVGKTGIDPIGWTTSLGPKLEKYGQKNTLESGEYLQRIAKLE